VVFPGTPYKWASANRSSGDKFKARLLELDETVIVDWAVAVAVEVILVTLATLSVALRDPLSVNVASVSVPRAGLNG